MTREQAEVWEERNETFLQMLYHHEQRQTVPVVDQHFVKELRSLNEEGQCKAMGHIERIAFETVSTSTVTPIETKIAIGRLQYLYGTWMKDQTKKWVKEHYGNILSDERWGRDLARRREQVRQRREEENGTGGLGTAFGEDANDKGEKVVYTMNLYPDQAAKELGLR